ILGNPGARIAPGFPACVPAGRIRPVSHSTHPANRVTIPAPNYTRFPALGRRMDFLINTDPAILRLIEDETERQANQLEMIASENFVSPAVMQAMGSALTNKYAEGYPGRRYYGGCEVVDEV